MAKTNPNLIRTLKGGAAAGALLLAGCATTNPLELLNNPYNRIDVDNTRTTSIMREDDGVCRTTGNTWGKEVQSQFVRMVTPVFSGQVRCDINVPEAQALQTQQAIELLRQGLTNQSQATRVLDQYAINVAQFSVGAMGTSFAAQTNFAKTPYNNCSFNFRRIAQTGEQVMTSTCHFNGASYSSAPMARQPQTLAPVETRPQPRRSSNTNTGMNI